MQHSSQTISFDDYNPNLTSSILRKKETIQILMKNYVDEKIFPILHVK